jgi:hypothetical protein
LFFFLLTETARHKSRQEKRMIVWKLRLQTENEIPSMMGTMYLKTAQPYSAFHQNLNEKKFLLCCKRPQGVRPMYYTKKSDEMSNKTSWRRRLEAATRIAAKKV